MIEISKDEAEQRLNNKSNTLVKHGTVWLGSNGHILNGERASNVKKLDDNTKLLVGALAQIVPHAQVGREFGLNQHRVGQIANGKVDGDREKGYFKDKDFAAKLEDIKSSVTERALNKVMDTLGLVTNEKLEKIPVQEIATVAKDISVIVRNVTGNDVSRPNVAQVILFAPNTRKEESYESIEVEARVV